MLAAARARTARFAAPAVLLALASCVYPPETVSSEVALRIHRIGVVSLVQDALSVGQSTSILALADTYDYPVPEWALQWRTEDVARQTLEAGGRYEVVPLAYDAEAIWTPYANDPVVSLRAMYDVHGGEALYRALEPVIAGQSLDAVVVIYPGYTGRYCGERLPCPNYGKYGFGLVFRRTGLLTPHEFAAYISVHIDLADAVSLQRIAEVDVNEHYPLSLARIEPSLAGYDAGERDQIRDAIFALLEAEISTGLYRMRLLP